MRGVSGRSRIFQPFRGKQRSNSVIREKSIRTPKPLRIKPAPRVRRQAVKAPDSLFKKTKPKGSVFKFLFMGAAGLAYFGFGALVYLSKGGPFFARLNFAIFNEFGKVGVNIAAIIYFFVLPFAIIGLTWLVLKGINLAFKKIYHVLMAPRQPEKPPIQARRKEVWYFGGIEPELARRMEGKANARGETLNLHSEDALEQFKDIEP